MNLEEFVPFPFIGMVKKTWLWFFFTNLVKCDREAAPSGFSFLGDMSMLIQIHCSKGHVLKTLPPAQGRRSLLSALSGTVLLTPQVMSCSVFICFRVFSNSSLNLFIGPLFLQEHVCVHAFA